MSYCKIDNLEMETKMNSFAISSFDSFQEQPVDDEPVSIEFGMDPVKVYLHIGLTVFKIRTGIPVYHI